MTTGREEAVCRVLLGAPPTYFEGVRLRAAALWMQLEGSPELAGPWHQLFKQVKSPRHVVSELLQNADDAGATAASVSIDDGEFVFSHNGMDFVEAEFASLCRFGYSNKRALHTIGFRGVGFKSTFSLGDEVRLLTPTLAVCFHTHRFTEPVWMPGAQVPTDRTEVRVVVRDENCRLEIEKNLKEWQASPTSLLFFKSIRALRVNESEVRWESHGPGPTERSEWMALSNAPDRRYLLIRSREEPFPDDALKEIRQERMTTGEEEVIFPPCEVEVVLGLEGRFFVVLPTGVRTALPFACNAPFVQDPARVKIKEPEISPTNRWLMDRVGVLAAQAMVGWAANEALSMGERCECYGLMPSADLYDSTLEAACKARVARAFNGEIHDKPFLITEQGRLEKSGRPMAVPGTLLDVWSAAQVQKHLLGDKYSVLSRMVSGGLLTRLVRTGHVTEFQVTGILNVLASQRLPKPQTWRQLLLLWALVGPQIAGRRFVGDRRDLRIIPVQGKSVLYGAGEVVRLAEKRLLPSPDDWEFLAQHLLVLNQYWPQFLAEQRREAEQRADLETVELADEAYKVLTAVGLDQTTTASSVLHKVADAFFAEDDPSREDCIRLTQIAAALGATVDGDFRYVTKDGSLTRVAYGVLSDLRGDLDLFVDAEWYEDHGLHDDYYGAPASCSEPEWRSWLASERSGLLGFPPLQQTRKGVAGKKRLSALLVERGISDEPHYHYVTSSFLIEDWDFDPCHWRTWESMAEIDEAFWALLCTRILQQPATFWQKALSAEILQIGTTHKTHPVTKGDPLPAWICRLRELPCLQDTRGIRRRPADLLRRTPETEVLLDVEPFVRADLDVESTRPLLSALGVRDTPTGPEGLLDRLRALAKAVSPPVLEVMKWYERLDQMLEHCSTEEIELVRNALRDEKIVLTDTSLWARSGEVFVNADEEHAPGAALVHPGVKHLALWRAVGVADRPTADLAIAWLQTLSRDDALSADEVRRITSLTARYPFRVWEECGYWLNLEGTWIPVKELTYSLTLQTLLPWKHLFPQVKYCTADFQKLPVEVSSQPPFAMLPSLARSIEERPVASLDSRSDPEARPWLIALGGCLRRVVLSDASETEAIRGIGARIEGTHRQLAEGLEVVPYIRNQPVGLPRQVDALWLDSRLYVRTTSAAKMAAPVSAEVGRTFGRMDLTDAVKICYERSPDFVTEYMEENFKLEAPPADNSNEAAAGQSPADNRLPDHKSDHSNGGDAVSGTDESPRDDNEWPDKPGDSSGGDTEDASETEEEDDVQRSHRPRNRGPGLMERYALSHGYSPDGDESYVRVDGHRIQKAPGSIFPWELVSPDGEVIKQFWAKDHCLDRAPMEIEAEIWTCCTERPNANSVILLDRDGSPVEYTGAQLQEMCGTSELVLYPAKYRLVLREQ